MSNWMQLGRAHDSTRGYKRRCFETCELCVSVALRACAAPAICPSRPACVGQVWSKHIHNLGITKTKQLSNSDFWRIPAPECWEQLLGFHERVTHAVTMSAWVARAVTMFAGLARAVTMFAGLALRHNAKNGYGPQYHRACGPSILGLISLTLAKWKHESLLRTTASQRSHKEEALSRALLGIC